MSEYKTPDSILVGEEGEGQPGSQANEEALKIAAGMQRRYLEPFSLSKRIVYLISSAGILLWVFVLFWVVLFSSLAALLFLGSNEDLNRRFQEVFNYFTGYVVQALGFIIAIFSPALGIGLINWYKWLNR